MALPREEASWSKDTSAVLSAAEAAASVSSAGDFVVICKPKLFQQVMLYLLHIVLQEAASVMCFSFLNLFAGVYILVN